MAVIWRERLDGRAAIRAQIRRFTSIAPHRPSLSRAQRAADRLLRNPAKPPRLASVARAVGSSETSLRREFKKEYGVTPREYHQRVRVGHALILMVERNGKLSTIGHAAGYGSEAHFHRSVRRYTGRTPGALRRLPTGTLLRIAGDLLPPRRTVAAAAISRRSATGIAAPSNPTTHRKPPKGLAERSASGRRWRPA